MNRIRKIEIAVVVVILLALALFAYPKYALKETERLNSMIKANCSIATANILAQFAYDPNIKPSEVIAQAVSILSGDKNPVNKNEKPYTIGRKCRGCVVFEADDANNKVIIEGYGEKVNLLTRTIVTPPSFVVYDQEPIKNLIEEPVKLEEPASVEEPSIELKD